VHEVTDGPKPEGQSATGTPVPPTKPVPRVVMRVVSPFGWRHVSGIAVIRFLVAVWLVCLGTIYLAFGQWWGALIYVGAGAIGWLAYQMPRWKLALDAEKNDQRVHELERSRAHAVDDAAARLRRIEQDLHDGAQAQMVAVVMKLGLARDHLGRAVTAPGQADPQRALELRALELVEAAHRGALEAIAELRDLARGIHPPALDEGLGVALAGLVARGELDVDLVVDIPERPSASIETIAYFCAAELLTNVAKHSGVRHATLEARHGPDVVRIRVSDEGTGGARIEGGSGLAGLAERVRTVDGRLEVDSPMGGPTVITVELPSHA
jgi:signal transduction histidine kinase